MHIVNSTFLFLMFIGIISNVQDEMDAYDEMDEISLSLLLSFTAGSTVSA